MLIEIESMLDHGLFNIGYHDLLNGQSHIYAVHRKIIKAHSGWFEFYLDSSMAHC